MESSDSTDLRQCRESASGTAYAPRRLLRALLLCSASLWLGWFIGTPAIATEGTVPAVAPGLDSFVAATADELVRILEENWGDLRMDGRVAPPMAPRRLPSGLEALPIPLKKVTFVRAVLPLVLQVNAEVAAERQELKSLVRELREHGGLDAAESRRLSQLAACYRVQGAGPPLEGDRAEEVIEELRLRVDQVPVSLALAQAALESGWGTSRFAVEGNSLFGQWAFSAKGMTPTDRPEGANYSVARFRTLLNSVAAYVRNLNTSWAYAEYRELRAAMRGEEGGRLDPLGLAGELTRYSARREAYVSEIRSVIRGNRLARFDDAQLLAEFRTASMAADGGNKELAMGTRSDAGPPDA